MPNALIYCRVSSQEQVSNFSLEDQEIECRRLADRQGLTVTEVYVEEGESAKTIARTQLQRLLRDCAKPKVPIAAVIVYSIDRLSRDTVDFMSLWAGFTKMNINLVSVANDLALTPEGKFSATLIAASAQYDNDRRSERSRDGMKRALKHGRWP